MFRSGVVLAVLFLLAAFCFAEDPPKPEKPVELSKADLDTLWSLNAEKREAVLRKYDGKLLKLSGEAHFTESHMFNILPRPKGAEGNLMLKLEFTDHAANSDLKARSRKRYVRTTVYGRASFSRQVERPTKDYKIPEHLKPKKGIGLVDPMDLGTAINENNDRIKAIMQDARKKKQTEYVTVYGLFSLTDAVTNPRYLPKKKDRK